MQTTVVRRQFRGKAAILSLLEKQEQSGLSVRAFCSAHSLPEGNFHKWKSRYKLSDETATAVGFASVSLPALSSTLFAEVHGIRIYQAVSASYLKELAS